QADIRGFILEHFLGEIVEYVSFRLFESHDKLVTRVDITRPARALHGLLHQLERCYPALRSLVKAADHLARKLSFEDLAEKLFYLLLGEKQILPAENSQHALALQPGHGQIRHRPGGDDNVEHVRKILEYPVDGGANGF